MGPGLRRDDAMEEAAAFPFQSRLPRILGHPHARV